jgi:UDP-N-acetyl-D-mannosaminuronate dehydrogenase
VVQDPLFSPEELRALGLDPWDGTSPVDAAVVQADHREYADLDTTAYPGIRVIVDGRHVLDPGRWHGVSVIQLGVASR